jgi:hypothetical protein
MLEHGHTIYDHSMYPMISMGVYATKCHPRVVKSVHGYRHGGEAEMYYSNSSLRMCHTMSSLRIVKSVCGYGHRGEAEMYYSNSSLRACHKMTS